MENKNPVLPSLEPLLKDLRYVKINYEKIRELAPRIAKERLQIPKWNFPQFIDEDSKATIDFFFLGNTINFAYRDFDTMERFSTYYQGKLLLGASAMFACLKRAIEDEIPILDTKTLTLIGRKDMRNIFRGNMEIPMLDERLEIFHEVGKVLHKKYQNHFYNLCKETNFKAFNNGKGIVEVLAKDFTSFNDVSYLEEKELKFYKRAQLAVAMTYGRLRPTNLFPISDIDELTVFADYCLPAGLHDLDILNYEKKLEEKIKKGGLIEPNNREELEIRVCTLKASEELKNEINKYRKEKINSLHLDAYLWFTSRDLKHHLCKTIAY